MPGGHTRQHSQRATDAHRVTQGGAGKGKRILAGAVPPDDKTLAVANSGPTDGPGMGQGIMGVPVTGPGPKAEPIELKCKSRQRSPLMPPDVKPVVIKEEWGQVILPLAVNTTVDCKWRDSEFRLAKVVERRARADKPDEYEYYVHYDRLNRRMDEWVRLDQMDLSTVDPPDGAEPGRQQRRKVEDDEGEHHGFDASSLREHEEFTKVKNVERIELGRFEMETWYFSPLPPEFKDCKKLYFVEGDLSFFKHRSQMLQHLRKCKLQHPPGDEIYRNGNVSMFEVDGKKEKLYCQNLCYLAKLFLDHKTLYYDVDLFLFYVLCECDERGAHPVGYFSKEKNSEEGYNLACILTLPSYQRKGYGKFLIAMSYELSKMEGRVGTPERPLSDLGLVSYVGYWARQLLQVLAKHSGPLSIKDLSTLTGIKVDDIIYTLQSMQLVQYYKGQHVLCAVPAVIEWHLKRAGGVGLEVDPDKIVWTPYNAEREYQSFRN